MIKKHYITCLLLIFIFVVFTSTAINVGAITDTKNVSLTGVEAAQKIESLLDDMTLSERKGKVLTSVLYSKYSFNQQKNIALNLVTDTELNNECNVGKAVECFVNAENVIINEKEEYELNAKSIIYDMDFNELSIFEIISELPFISNISKGNIEYEKNTDISYKSEDTTIASVDNKGKIKALKEGNTKILIIFNNYTTLYVDVTVKPQNASRPIALNSQRFGDEEKIVVEMTAPFQFGLSDNSGGNAEIITNQSIHIKAKHHSITNIDDLFSLESYVEQQISYNKDGKVDSSKTISGNETRFFISSAENNKKSSLQNKFSFMSLDNKNYLYFIKDYQPEFEIRKASYFEEKNEKNESDVHQTNSSTNTGGITSQVYIDEDGIENTSYYSISFNKAFYSLYQDKSTSIYVNKKGKILFGDTNAVEWGVEDSKIAVISVNKDDPYKASVTGIQKGTTRIWFMGADGTVIYCGIEVK